MQVQPATASLYIANPLRGQGMASLFSTHPPMEERIRRLAALDRGASPAYAAADVDRAEEPARGSSAPFLLTSPACTRPGTSR